MKTRSQFSAPEVSVVEDGLEHTFDFGCSSFPVSLLAMLSSALPETCPEIGITSTDDGLEKHEQVKGLRVCTDYSSLGQLLSSQPPYSKIQ